MPRTRKLLPPEKIRLVQVARSQLGIEEAAYRSLLMRAGGVSSSRDLTEAGFRMVMDEFARLGFQSDSNRRNLGRRPGFATAGQVASIRRLWAEYTGGQGTETQLGKWLEKTWSVSALRFLTAEQGPKAITALRAMCARQPSRNPQNPALDRHLTPEVVEYYRAMRQERLSKRLPELPDELLTAAQLAYIRGWEEEEAEHFLASAFALMAQPEPPLLVYDVGEDARDFRVSLASLPAFVQLFWHDAMIRKFGSKLDMCALHMLVIETAELRWRHAPE